jgi:hypothetical protein
MGAKMNVNKGRKKTKMNIGQILARAIQGDVADANDVQYRETVEIDNGRIRHKPKFIVYPESDADVSKTIEICKEEEVQLTCKSGGHSAAGYCLNTGGIVMDLRRLNTIAFDADTQRLRVGAGVRWSQVYQFMQNTRTGMVPVGGGCPGVGVAGFLQGGGFSFLSRSYGLGCDNMHSVRMVDVRGGVHHAKRTSTGPLGDLFWGLCGGGGGNFGVATEFEIEVRKPGYETMLMGEIAFPFYRIEEVLPFYNKWVQQLPNEMAVYGRIANVTDPRSGERILTLLFTPVFNGPFSEGVAMLAPLASQTPIRMELQQMMIPEWENYIGTRTSVAGRSAYMRSLVLPPLSLDFKMARIFMKYMSRAPSAESFVVWTHTGGSIKSSAKSKGGCFPHRDCLFVPELKSIWDSAQPHAARSNIEWGYDFFEELGATATGAYLNYIDPLLTDWKRKYYGNSLNRLKQLKQKWDPKGFFGFQQGIASNFQPSGAKPLDLSPLLVT